MNSKKEERFVLQGHIIVPDTDLATVKAELPIHQNLTQQECGCLVFSVAQDKNNPNRFNVYEEFIDEKSFKKHQLRIKGTNWAKATTNVTRNYQIIK